MVDPTDLLHKIGGDAAANHISEHVAPALANVGTAVGSAVSPFVNQATQVCILLPILSTCTFVDALAAVLPPGLGSSNVECESFKLILGNF